MAVEEPRELEFEDGNIRRREVLKVRGGRSSCCIAVCCDETEEKMAKRNESKRNNSNVKGIKR